MSPRPISEYAFLSDCDGAGLVHRSGRVDRMCLPRFDSPALFAGLLDDSGGRDQPGRPDRLDSTRRTAVTTRYDNIIVGAGQAGPSLAGRFEQQGQPTAFVERQKVGGTCVNYGCTPTKALVASARIAHQARRAGDFGVDVSGVTVDMPAVHERMNEVVAASHDGLLEWIENMDHVDFIRGHARFTGDRRLEVNGRDLTADRVFLNVGARPAVPPIEGLEEVDHLTSTTILELTEVPDHLVAIGGGPVSLEFAQMFRRFGSEVTVVEQKPQLFGAETPDVAEAVRQILEDEDIAIRLETECMAVSDDDGAIRVRGHREDGDDFETVGSHLLVATGRTPNTDDLGLEHAGVRTDERGYIEVDDRLATRADGVWALGECNGHGPFTHTAYNDYTIVAANLLDDTARSLADRIPCYALYTDPPLGRVGITEDQARNSDRDVLVGRMEMADSARAAERGETAGFLKLLADAESDEILGAAVLGTGGDEVVHIVLSTMYSGGTCQDLARAMHIHPTVAEMLPSLASQLEPLE